MSDSEAEDECSEIRVAFVGEPSVGKTGLIRRLCYDEFSRQYTATVGADFYIRRISLPTRQEVTLKLTDVGGLELRGSMLDKYLFHADVTRNPNSSQMIILVYDITNPTSFDYLSNWLGVILAAKESAPITAVIGNKCDLEHQRAVRLDKTNQFILDHNLIGLLMSAKTGESVNTGILDLVSRHMGLPPLTKMQKEQHQAVLKVELTPSPPEVLKRKVHVQHTKSSICLIEKYTENVRFCIICNYLSKIIPALQSRCTRFRFGPVPSMDMAPVIHMVAEMEKLNVHNLGLDSIVQLSKGDLRKALNVLQSTAMSYDKITEENVYLCVGHPRPADIQYVIETILTNDFKTSYHKIRELQTNKGFALQDILTEAQKYLYRIEFPFEFLIDLWDAMAEIEFRLAAGSNESMQLTAFIAALQKGKSIVPPTD